MGVHRGHTANREFRSARLERPIEPLVNRPIASSAGNAATHRVVPVSGSTAMVSITLRSISCWFYHGRSNLGHRPGSRRRSARLDSQSTLKESCDRNDDQRSEHLADDGSYRGSAAGVQLSLAVQEISRWMSEFGPFETHSSLVVDSEQLARSFTELTDRFVDGS